MQRYFYWSLLLVFFGQARAQEIPLGTWRTHACYRMAKQVAVGKEGIYCATQNGLFLFDVADKSYQPLSKMQGLSSATPAQIAYDTHRQCLWIAYPDRTLDVWRDNELTTISLLRNVPLAGSPQIHAILPTNTLVYLATDFGVVLLDAGRQEIKETYRNLGENGAELAIMGLAFSQDSLALATAQGIIIGSKTGNLVDFQQWKRFGAANGLPTGAFRKIVARQNTLYALSNSGKVYKYAHLNRWEQVASPTETYQDIAATDTEIVLASVGKVSRLSTQDILTVEAVSLLQNPLSVALDGQKTWIADQENGLVARLQTDWSSFYPNSPAFEDVWQMSFGENRLWVTAGGVDDGLVPLQREPKVSIFEQGQWQIRALPTLKDITAYAYTVGNKARYWASYGKGLLREEENGTTTLFTDANSSLVRSNLNDLRVSALATDAQGGLWVANHAVPSNKNSLHLFQKGTWQGFLPPSPAGQYPVEILIAQNGWKWIRLSDEGGGGIWVLDNEGNRSRVLSATPNAGGLPNAHVSAVAEDKDGAIWVGTNRGIGVFYAPQQAFSTINATLPIYINRPLLRDEEVTAIVIDGGNRKWIGTNAGLWLFDATGEHLLQHFHTANSPLPSNRIKKLHLHPQTGELFVHTEAGMASYRGTATEAGEEFSDVSVFPNPVLPHFDGLVGISGLPTGARVKITDVSGRVFHETTAQGGTASWNVQDYQGNRAKSGIYLAYVFKADGSEAKVFKIAVLE